MFLRTGNILFGLGRFIREDKDARERCCSCCLYFFTLLVLLCRFLESESFFEELVPYPLFILLGINQLSVIYYCFLSFSDINCSSVDRMIVRTL